ncbi:MAG: hypothetical protein ACKO2D_09790 [Chloroflexota bacterium]
MTKPGFIRDCLATPCRLVAIPRPQGSIAHIPSHALEGAALHDTRIVVTAVNHLNRFTARLTVTRFEERRGRLRRAFRDVVDAAIEMKAVALVLGG